MIAKLATLLLAAAQAASLSAETGRLEGLVASGKARSQDRIRLAQIYFLTSRCADVRRIADASTRSLACACGGECDESSKLGKIMKLRALLEKPTPWADRELQAAWKDVARAPAAQYAMLRYLMTYPPARSDSRLRQLRGELESRLQGLEVSP